MKSNNKPETTWTVINELLGKHHSSQDIEKLTIDGRLITNPISIAEEFNKYFSSIIDNLNNGSQINSRQDNVHTRNYLKQYFGIF